MTFRIKATKGFLDWGLDLLLLIGHLKHIFQITMGKK